MTVKEMYARDEQVLEILKGASEPLSVPEIEKRLDGERVEADTFDVRDCLWRLVREKKADFTPWRQVVLAGRL